MLREAEHEVAQSPRMAMHELDEQDAEVQLRGYRGQARPQERPPRAELAELRQAARPGVCWTGVKVAALRGRGRALGRRSASAGRGGPQSAEGTGPELPWARSAVARASRRRSWYCCFVSPGLRRTVTRRSRHFSRFAAAGAAAAALAAGGLGAALRQGRPSSPSGAGAPFALGARGSGGRPPLPLLLLAAAGAPSFVEGWPPGGGVGAGPPLARPDP